jgi:hypothetical protein
LQHLQEAWAQEDHLPRSWGYSNNEGKTSGKVQLAWCCWPYKEHVYETSECRKLVISSEVLELEKIWTMFLS